MAGVGFKRRGEKMNSSKLYRGQPKKFDNCLFVPSALRGYWSNHYPFSGIGCCNDCTNIPKVEKFFQDLGIDTAPYKKECATIARKGPFQGCDDGIPYVFWLSIVFCEYKISHAGKNMSFMGGGLIPFSIDMSFVDSNDSDSFKPKLLCACTVEEYAKKIAQCYFGYTPPATTDNFIRKYMDHQHYSKGNDDGDPCIKGSHDYESWPKSYKIKGGDIIDGNDLPDHFTFLLDWTKSRDVAKKFAGSDGTIVSIDSEKYDAIIGANYKMSYDDKILGYFLIDTADRQKSIVTFWPWTFTISELENNEFGHALDFRRE
jgi:hypothetical protein